VALKKKHKNSGIVSAVLVLAAGQGKRMKSDLPKVLHLITGRPLIFHILDRIRESLPRNTPVAVLVGHEKEKVEAAIRSEERYSEMQITFVTQENQLGTGDAVRSAMESEWGQQVLKTKRPLLVLPGDVPMMTGAMVAGMGAPLNDKIALRLLTTKVPDPKGYGRVLRTAGKVKKIVEEKDTTSKEKNISEVAMSIYLFDSSFLASGLKKLKPKNTQQEFYLTDLVQQAAAAKGKSKIEVYEWRCFEDLLGVNDQYQLSQMNKAMNHRNVKYWALSGVRILDIDSVWIDSGVVIQPGVALYQGVILTGRTVIGRNTVVGPRVVLHHVEVGEEVELKLGTSVEISLIDAGAVIGPYARIRPNSVIGEGSKIGNFVELKKTRIGKETSIAHLSYLGDAEVGDRVNIGCGFVTCNFDGRVIDGERKHKTKIGDDVFIGSDCQTVAPVEIGRGSYVASGSTITENVEPDSLAIARSRQVNKKGYAAKLRGEKK